KLQQSAFDPPQHRLDPPPGHLPGPFERDVALRIIAEIIGELGARTTVAQAAGLINDYRIRRRTIRETRRILEIRLSHAIPQPPLQCQRHTLPYLKILRLAFRWSV